MTALCSANKYLAERNCWPYHVDPYAVKAESENWKVALTKARDATLKKGKSAKQEGNLQVIRCSCLK